MLAAAVLFALASAPADAPSASAAAPPAEPTDVANDADKAGPAIPEYGVSARVLLGAAGVRHGAPMVGAGVAVERDLAGGLLALELAFEVLSSPEAHAALLEFVVEKPIEINDDVGLYFGGGPTLGYHAPLHDRPEVAWGGIALVGVEYFLGAGFEVFVELDTALLMLPHPILEADVGTGVMYRF